MHFHPLSHTLIIPLAISLAYCIHSKASHPTVLSSKQITTMSNSTTSFSANPEDFRVYGLEKIQPAYAEFEGKMYAGMLDSDNNGRTGRTMFWMFRPDTQAVEKTLVLWLNGGPGCSSFNCGVMMEHSPVTQPLHHAGYCCLEPSPELHVNPHSWTRATTMLYVEHPIGTGFSYGHPYPETEEEASGDLDAFLQNFYKVFTDLQDYDFYVVGESYAGMFVPSVSRYIHNANKHSTGDRIQVKLKGAAMGNGWIEPKIQGPATIDYSWWHGLIDKPTRDALHTEWENCMYHLENGDSVDEEPGPFHAFNVQDDCGIMWGILQAAGNPNAYDITTWDPNVDQITFTSEAFYNDPIVKDALHVDDKAKDHFWHGCQAGSGRRFLSPSTAQHRKMYMDNDRPLSVTPYIGELLDEGIPVLVYNGDRDMTTNMVGQELCLNNMEWDGMDHWLDAPRGLWKVKDYPAGWGKEYKSLTFVVVYNSGHMVPYNVPNSAYDLLTRLLTNKSFLDEKAPQIRVDPIKDASTTIIDLGTRATTTSPLHGNGLLPIVMATLVGFVVGIVVMKWKNNNRGGYQRVPEVAQS